MSPVAVAFHLQSVMLVCVTVTILSMCLNTLVKMAIVSVSTVKFNLVCSVLGVSHLA